MPTKLITERIVKIYISKTKNSSQLFLHVEKNPVYQEIYVSVENLWTVLFSPLHFLWAILQPYVNCKFCFPGRGLVGFPPFTLMEKPILSPFSIHTNTIFHIHSCSSVFSFKQVITTAWSLHIIKVKSLAHVYFISIWKSWFLLFSKNYILTVLAQSCLLLVPRGDSRLTMKYAVFLIWILLSTNLVFGLFTPISYSPLRMWFYGLTIWWFLEMDCL